MRRLFKTKSLIILAFFFSLILIALLIINSNVQSKKDVTSTYSSKINVSNIIDNIKKQNENLTLVYESNLKEIKSLVYLENEIYKNILIDLDTGKIIDFEDLIKDRDNYSVKEIELLKEKYPEFIVNDITSSEDSKTYFVKDNEVTIYYAADRILTINYNDIKDYLNFTPLLDENYTKDTTDTHLDKAVALTLDDGPSIAYNSLILEELNKHKAHATFFMVGKMMNSCPSCVINTYKSGNEVGNHTYDHLNIKSKSQDLILNNLEETNRIYKNLTGDDIKLFRPAYGSYGGSVKSIEMPIILWNLDTEDWRYHNVDHIVDYILNNVSDGSIILMHELYKTSYEALKIVLPELYKKGYKVVSASELANLKGRTLENGKAYISIR